MRLDAVKMLGIFITNNPKEEILEEIWKGLKKIRKMGQKTPQMPRNSVIVVTPNPEQIVAAQKNFHFREILNRADLALPDGIGVVWASRFLAPWGAGKRGKGVTEAIPGIDFMENLVWGASKRGLPIALIGSYHGVAVRAFECLQKKCPNLVGWGVDAPEFETKGEKVRFKNYDEKMKEKSHKNSPSSSQSSPSHLRETEYFQALAKRIIDTGVRLVFVGLGAPKQEYFIEKLRKAISDKQKEISKNKTYHVSPISYRPFVFMSVGGSFDEISGRIPMAPTWMRRMGFKWLWRLILEPWRIKRQLALLVFIFLVLRKRFSLK